MLLGQSIFTQVLNASWPQSSRSTMVPGDGDRTGVTGYQGGGCDRHRCGRALPGVDRMPDR
jgi:hypothetical protein